MARFGGLMMAAASLLAVGAACADGERPIVGAIRWDAWHTPWSRVKPGSHDGPVSAMIASLGPKQYHWRLPFFASVVSDTEVRIDGYTQEVLDREIAFARRGGLDYWAFLLYEEDSAMSQGLSLYLTSARRREMPFCVITSPNTFGNAQMFPERMQRVVKLISEPGYQRVMGGRPLLYLFNVSDAWMAAWGGPENARKLFDGLRAAVKAAGQGDPYLVVMDFHPEQGKKTADVVGAEAISSYAASAGGMNGTPYADLRAHVHGFWERCAKTGAQVVPLAMAGWDRRPRIEHPVPWEKYQKPGEGMERYYATPTPPELTAHIEEAMRWTAARKEQCPAQAVILYAWNEHDEGGWLCPTLNPDGTANTERLDALAAMLNAFRATR